MEKAGGGSIELDYVNYDDFFFENVEISPFEVAEAAFSLGVGFLAEPFHRKRRGLFSDLFSKFEYKIRKTAGYVVAWCADDGFQNETRKMIFEKIRTFKPDVILAHSLGSLISYDAFTHDEADAADLKAVLSKASYVTLGSQVNNNFVRGHLANGYLTMPKVARWHHLYNKHDPVFTAEIRYGERIGPRFLQSETTFKDIKFKGEEISEHSAPGYITHDAAVADLWLPVLAGAAAARGAARAMFATPKKGKKVRKRAKQQKALLVGINDYQAPVTPLEGCVNDVFLMSSVLQECDIPYENIRTVLDRRATAEAILSRLEWLLADAASGDELIFYFSGHGARYPEYNAQDMPDRFIEALVTADFDWSRGRCIKDRDIVDLYSQLPYDCRLLMIFDCCHSGGLHRNGTAKVRGLTPPDDIRHRMLYWDRKKSMWADRKFDRLNANYTKAKQEGIDIFGPEGASELIGRASMLRMMDEKKYKALKKKNPEKAQGAYLPLIIEACQAHEFAYEYRHGATSYGAFTYSLANNLRREKGISFDKLVKTTSAQLKDLGYEQEPNIVGPDDIKKANVPWNIT
ncbi:caspase family protein [Labrenzia sp. PHM005]|uniref:caspase family protein n=1 Tax=Labrenzia sp. PHM005 TaxID=2590016 RepID=UPI001FFCF6C2|nr:caspase family protein [Labrenzia sp. PHM005]